MQLVEDIGFDAVDAGTIEQSWRQQPGSPGYLEDYDAAGVRQALAGATEVRTPDWRATPNSPGTFISPA
jgi:8-hydroxy-5-deazaflavin:NADPH oxidoreductase